MDRTMKLLCVLAMLAVAGVVGHAVATTPPEYRGRQVARVERIGPRWAFWRSHIHFIDTNGEQFAYSTKVHLTGYGPCPRCQ